MSIILPDNRSLAAPTRRTVLLGLAATFLSAPAVVRASSIMPVRVVLITEPDRRYAGFIERLWYESWASRLLQHEGITMPFNGRNPTLSEAERSQAERAVRYALKYGFLSSTRTEKIRLLFAEGRQDRPVKTTGKATRSFKISPPEFASLFATS